MTDHKDNATTTATWQDNHSGKRGHRLMTKKLAETIPAIGANEKARDYDDVLAPAKLFSPYNGWTWYITEMDPVTGQCFGLVEGFQKEIGYFDLTELAETTVFGSVPAVERDLYWEPRTLGEIKSGTKGDPPRSQETDGGGTMTDEAGTETRSPDAVRAEEFLFGTASDDAPADVADEFPAGDASDNAGDTETAGEPDADTDTETAVEEPDATDDAGEQTAPADTEISEELKVVLSIKGGRATIGVQRPSADPHIESFDYPDLLELADQFPAVVARARAIWEETPQHPAYEKPAPTVRRRGRRQQDTTPPATNEVEADQRRPETLRLF